MQKLKITFVNQHFIENKIDIDAYKKAINSAFDSTYTFEFEIDNSRQDDAQWEEHGGISIINGFASDMEFNEIKQKLLEIYHSLKSV